MMVDFFIQRPFPDFDKSIRIPCSVRGFLLCGIILIGIHAANAVTATLKRNDKSPDFALFDASAWEGGTEIFPDPSVDYYTKNYTILTKCQKCFTFNGRSLIVGDCNSNTNGTLALRTSDSVGDQRLLFTGDGGLVLSRGAIDNYNTYCTVVSGKVSIASVASRPFNVYAPSGPKSQSELKANCQFEGILQSEESAVLFFYSGAKASSDIAKSCYRILSDTTKYLGKICVAQEPTGTSKDNDRVTLELGKSYFPGSLKMMHHTTLEAYCLGASVKIKNLELNKNSALSMRWDASLQQGSGFEVENELLIEAPVEIRPSRFNASYDDAGFRIPLLKAPLGVKLKEEDFVFIGSRDKAYDEFLSPVVNLEISVGEDGRYVLWARSRPIKRALAGDDTTTGSLCFDPAAPDNNWPNGEIANSECDYVSAYSLRSLGSKVATCVFGGNSLTFKPVSDNVKLALRCPVVEVADLRIDLSSKSFAFDNYSGGDTTTNTFATRGTMAVKGKLRLLSDADKNNELFVYPANKGYIRIDSDISGDGNIEAQITGSESKSECYTELAGDNSRWIGQLKLTKKPSDSDSYSCVLFRDAENLGGPLSAFFFKALHLGSTGRLRPLQSVTLDEPTRGMYVAGAYCRVEVDEGVDFVFKQRITYEGNLTKTGGGTFALGGDRPWFNGSETLPPAEGQNLLTIAEGAFTPLSSDAFDGVSVSFAEGTKIVLGIPEDFNEGVGKWGMALTNEYSSIVLPENGIPVSLAMGTEPPGRRFDVPICTVKMSDAEMIRGKFILASRNPFKWYVSEIAERDNGDGTVTFLLSTCYSWFVITIR